MSIVSVLFIVAQSAGPFVPAAGASHPSAQVSALTELVAALDVRNPELAVARREIDVKRARVTPADARPDPVVTFGYMAGVDRPPFFPASTDPFGYRQIGISQEVPFGGTLTARKRAVEADVSYATEGLEVTRAGLVEKLKTAYVDYLYATRAREIVLRSKATLDELARTAEARFSVGKATQQDVLRAQLEVTRALARLTMLDADARQQRVEINRLLARPADTDVPAIEPVVGDEGAESGLALTHAAGHVPAHIAHHDAAVTLAELQVEAVKTERRPTLSFDFLVRNPGGGQPWMTGADVSVTLPLFWKRKQEPRLQEALASVDVARADRDRILADVEAMAGSAHVQVEESRRLLALYADSLLPQTRLTSDAALAAYEVGNVDFLTLVSSSLAVFDVELAQVEQQRQLRRALVMLEPLVGRELVK
ncbi:MAG: TolC family protein [Vicinamibacterales bacterium]